MLFSFLTSTSNTVMPACKSCVEVNSAVILQLKMYLMKTVCAADSTSSQRHHFFLALKNALWGGGRC